jgi:hypothetical protein
MNGILELPENSHPYQASAFVEITVRPPAYEGVLSCLSAGTLYRLQRTCRSARTAVVDYCRRVFNVDKHLKRFFDDPHGFRQLQASTGTLISGSNALQFLHRSFYPGSDLDIYTHPIHAHRVCSWLVATEGYHFVGKSVLYRDFETETNETPPDTYRFGSIHNVYFFTKPRNDGFMSSLQVIQASRNPLECILSFHSSKCFLSRKQET